jgi:hypothetical protein
MEEYDEIIVKIPIEKSANKARREQTYLNIVTGLNEKLVIPSSIIDQEVEVFNNKLGFIKPEQPKEVE